MSIYTVCNCLLQNLENEKKLILSILYNFANQATAYKIAVDRTGRVIDLYSSLAASDHHIFDWLDAMGMAPSMFERIDVDLSEVDNEDEIFLKTCASTKVQKKLIVYSHERWETVKYETEPENTIVFDENAITIFDRNEAMDELHKSKKGSVLINAKDSIVAMDGSQISDATNE